MADLISFLVGVRGRALTQEVRVPEGEGVAEKGIRPPAPVPTGRGRHLDGPGRAEGCAGAGGRGLLAAPNSSFLVAHACGKAFDSRNEGF